MEDAMQTDVLEPIACTLELEARNQRFAWIRRFTAQSLVSHETSGQTLHLTYRLEAYPELERIVNLERSCCAFLDFRLTQEPKGCVLSVTIPNGTAEAAQSLVANLVPREEAPITTKSCGCGPGVCG